MSHKFLFYLEALTGSEASVNLSGDEHHHLNRVLRMDAGEEVYVTNGRGLMVKCKVVKKEGDSTRLSITGPVDIPDHPREISLALACIKKDRFEIALAHCTELGIRRCIPYRANRSPAGSFGPQYIERLKKIAIASMKQSFQATLPAIDPVMEFSELIESLPKEEQVLVGSLDASPLDVLRLRDRLIVVVGPEAGFTDVEFQMLKARGATFVTVSSHRLRSETAAAALVSAIQRPT